MIFKKKKVEDKCFHMWKLRDYKSGVDANMSLYELYEITCTECHKSRFIEIEDYEKLKDLGLLLK